MSTGTRVTACNQCQKHKVRCTMENGKPPCRRCQRRLVPCTQRRLASRGDREDSPNTALVQDLKNIHAALNELRQAQSKPPLPPLQTTLEGHHGPGISTPESLGRNDEGRETDMLVEEDSQFQADIDRTPINSLYRITRLKSLRSQQIAPQSSGSEAASHDKPAYRDIISQGILEHADADRLVRNYLGREDHYLYDIAGTKHKDLEDIRKASPLLLTAICTVSALQSSADDALYRTCQGELRKRILDFLFTPVLDLEDLKGLIIASFWLSDVSWTISGLVIRRALEVDLQSSFVAASAGAPAAAAGAQPDANHERKKLWYLSYICDQHLSTLYARSPMLGSQESILHFERYLTPDCMDNKRIMSQISLFRILRAVSDQFGGVGSNERIPPIFKPHLDSFNKQLDNWATSWLNCRSYHPVVGDYPSKAVTLHYHFSKLLVCSHVFRGLAHDGTMEPIPQEFRDTAQMAVESAMFVIDLTIRDSDITAALVGLPHYFHSMIAYACAFLIKTVTLYRDQVAIDMDHTRSMITKVIELCNARDCGRHHLVRWIGRGLQILLSECLGMPRTSGLVHSTAHNAHQASMDFLGAPADTSPTQYSGTSDDMMRAAREPNMIWDAAIQATFGGSSGRMQLHDDDGTASSFNSFGNQYGSLGYPDGDLLTGPEAHIEHFGLGLGLLG